MKPVRALTALLAAAGSLLLSQTRDDNTTRAIVPESVVLARPKPPAPTVTPTPRKPAGNPRYAPLDGAVAQSLRPAAESRQVGITIWKLRQAGTGDGSGARILVQEDSTSTEWVPERLGASAVLHEGDRIRLTVESPEAGFLYVIDRESYSSGQSGDPYLIFPTTRTRDGDNRVAGGKLIDIPDQGDRPNFFTLRNSRAGQKGEELTLLLTQEPLENLQIGAKPIALSQDQVAAWEKRWGVGKVERFELSGSAGKFWTKAEQEAAGSSRLLTQDDPPPQTVYRVVARKSDPFLFKVQLHYAPKAR